MTLSQWPREKEAANKAPYLDPSFKTKQDFFELISAFPDSLPPELPQAAHWVTQSDSDITTFEQQMLDVWEKMALHHLLDGQQMLMALTCAAALAQEPSLSMWEKVRGLKRNSWQIEHWLTNAMLAYAGVHHGASAVYAGLAKEIFTALDSMTLKSLSNRKNQEREGALAHWVDCQHKLDEIWWELRGWRDVLNYEEDSPLFSVLDELVPSEVVALVSQSQNPYLVNSVLLTTGGGPFSPRFKHWEQHASAAPVAFEDDGQWNNSVLIPLLLVDARRELLQTGQNLPRFDVLDADIEKAKEEIVCLVDAVVTILSRRQDAVALFTRWTSWLMRQLLLSRSEEDIQDVRSAAFVDNALIETIGSKLKGQPVIQNSPCDAAVWEQWCYRCVLASHAHSGYIDPPATTEFVNEWAIDSDDWHGEVGRQLLAHANLFVIFNKAMPGMAAHLLAYPIVRSTSPVQTWCKMWHSTHALREIVEFGNSDTSQDNYRSSSQAAELLLLLFCIGLAIWDQRTEQCTNNTSPLARSQVALHKSLTLAVREMREIDDTLNREKWRVAFQHLAIRRLMWEPQSSNEKHAKHPTVFCQDDLPTFSDYLRDAQGDAFELLALLASAALNRLDVPNLRSQLQAESINVSETVAFIRRLNQYHPRKYPVDQLQLSKLEAWDV